MKNIRLWILAGLLLISTVLFVDWFRAESNLKNINISVSADPSTIIADGKNQSILTVHVTENGRPRVNDLMQSYLSSGSGLLIPQWAFTDQNGIARITYTPTPFSPYDPTNGVVIVVLDTNIGRIIEVDKEQIVEVKLQAPAQ